MKYLILTISIFLTSFGVAQTQNYNSIFQEAENGETIKIVFNVSSYSNKTIISLKDNLSFFKKGFYMIHHDEVSNILTLKYNSQLEVKKVMSIFDKYGISHTNNGNAQLFKH